MEAKTTMLAAREKCEKNIFYAEFMSRVKRELEEATNSACSISVDRDLVRFYQGKRAAFNRLLRMPDEIIEDLEKPREETTGQPTML